mmetsp:Transcript_29519/g.62639  ORF Transcript_29519/g.62639 Transcript_29519/m.62639 type:complete len:223 (+) Transcript_29519:660-1328(+)
MLHQIGSDFIIAHLFRMLCRDDNRMNPLWNRHAILIVTILQSNLRLAIGTDPIQRPILAHLGKPGAQFRSQNVTHWHVLWSFLTCIPEHYTTVTSTDIFHLGGIDALCNVRTLLFQGYNDIACLVIQPLCGIIVSCITDCVTNDLLVINGGRCGDFTQDNDHSRLTHRLACNTRRRVESEACINNSIRNDIAEFVRVGFSHGFRCKKKGVSRGVILRGGGGN